VVKGGKTFKQTNVQSVGNWPCSEFITFIMIKWLLLSTLIIIVRARICDPEQTKVIFLLLNVFFKRSIFIKISFVKFDFKETFRIVILRRYISVCDKSVCALIYSAYYSLEWTQDLWCAISVSHVQSFHLFLRCCIMFVQGCFLSTKK